MQVFPTAACRGHCGKTNPLITTILDRGMELTREQQRIAAIAVAGLMTVSLAAFALYSFNDGDDDGSSHWSANWVDPVT